MSPPTDGHERPDRETRRRAGDTRERLIRATLDLVAAEGAGALSERRIAAEADVSPALVSRYFPSQASLLRESLLLYVAEEVERLDAVTAALRARAPGPEEVAAEIEALIGRPSGGPLAEFELHLQAARNPELREASARCFAAYEAFAATALELLGVEDPSRHASGFVALVTGLSIRRLATDSDDTEAVTGALLTLLIGAMTEG